MVTANKQLLSRHGPELLQAAEEAGAELRFEASACAAIPVIKVLRESLLAAEITAITGIVNGTTNFILTEMARGGLSYGEALARAQELGYAEADPTEDVNGADAAAKMAILSSHRLPLAGARSTTCPTRASTGCRPRTWARARRWASWSSCWAWRAC